MRIAKQETQGLDNLHMHMHKCRHCTRGVGTLCGAFKGEFYYRMCLCASRVEDVPKESDGDEAVSWFAALQDQRCQRKEARQGGFTKPKGRTSQMKRNKE